MIICACYDFLNPRGNEDTATCLYERETHNVSFALAPLFPSGRYTQGSLRAVGTGFIIG